MQYTRRLIFHSFLVLVFAVPLVLYTQSSELFELNKMLTTYVLTILIVSLWSIRCISEQRLIFKRTFLDIPILLFLASQLLSTFISIDTRTSLFGYYSRFHGGLLSYTAYSLLYWALIANVTKKEVRKLILAIFAATVVASFYAISEHFGRSPSCLFVTGEFNVDCWVQDVKLRPFSTFGQPNWLAAWLVAVIPLTWMFSLKEKFKSQNFLVYFGLSALFFLTLLFTKSRSGILAFGFVFAIFWGLELYKSKKIKIFSLTTTSLLLITVVIGTPWSPNVNEILTNSRSPLEASSEVGQVGTVLDRGGTASTEIRAIVWRGTFDLWKTYPILGSGTETFAHAYYQTRPVEHNEVSEWNFLYNKAHNEYLNFAATTGALGLSTYLFLLLAIAYTLFKNQSHAMLAGFVGIAITNFFGFSVVPVALLLFLFPAFAVAGPKESTIHFKLSNIQKIAIIFVLLIASYLLLITANYWRADLAYSKGQKQRKAGNYTLALPLVQKAVSLSPKEAIFHEELADIYAQIALASPDEKVIALAISHANTSKSLSPRSIIILKSHASTYSLLGQLDQRFLETNLQTLDTLKTLAPTDASVFYREALTLAKLGDTETAISRLKNVVVLKPSYYNACLLLGVLSEESGDIETARQEYEYILENIAADDKRAQEYLNDLN